MLLKIKGVKVPGDLECFEKDPQSDNLYQIKPKHLIPLGEALWPEAVKKKIAGYFAGIGIEYPLRQKLVEPNAYYFGGRANDLSKVNWQMVTDYFQWEATAWASDGSPARYKHCYDLMDAAYKKYGGIFSHHLAYLNVQVRGRSDVEE